MLSHLKSSGLVWAGSIPVFFGTGAGLGLVSFGSLAGAGEGLVEDEAAGEDGEEGGEDCGE